MLNKVSNPLTIIAIFSALAEGFASYALIKSPLEIQYIFVYFVMAFPTLIVLLFFGVLIFNNKALYAPSDFANQEHYLLINDLINTVSDGVESDLRNSEDGLTFSKPQILYISESLRRHLRKPDIQTPEERIELFLRKGPATTSEISNLLGISTSGTNYYLNILKTNNRVEERFDEDKKHEVYWQLPF
jgi:DNA-binding CsgD family transcriptional regulator